MSYKTRILHYFLRMVSKNSQHKCTIHSPKMSTFGSSHYIQKQMKQLMTFGQMHILIAANFWTILGKNLCGKKKTKICKKKFRKFERIYMCSALKNKSWQLFPTQIPVVSFSVV